MKTPSSPCKLERAHRARGCREGGTGGKGAERAAEKEALGTGTGERMGLLWG